MATTQDYLTQLQTDKQNLVNNLVEKGVEATNDETFTSLVPKVLDISGGGETYTPEYISFRGYTGTSLENALKNIDTSKITAFNNLFNACSYITSIDLSTFDISNGSNLSYMFYDCINLVSLSNFKVGPNNTNIDHTFYNCNKLSELDVSEWDTSNITNMGALFWRCYKIPSLDVSKWNTSNVTSFGSTFQQMSSLKELDVSNFDTSKCTTFSYMFYNTPVENLDMSKWDTSKSTNFQYMFYAGKMTEYDVSNFSFENAKNLDFMFSGCNSCTKFVLNSDIPLVTDMTQMFSTCPKLQNIDLSCFIGGSACEMDYMFSGCSELREVNLSNLKCYGNKTIAYMFSNCKLLEKIDMRSYDFTKITSSSNYSNILYKVPTTCEIIVMNDDVKTWFNTNFADYTNVKTVAELEATE